MKERIDTLIAGKRPAPAWRPSPGADERLVAGINPDVWQWYAFRTVGGLGDLPSDLFALLSDVAPDDILKNYSTEAEAMTDLHRAAVEYVRRENAAC